MLSLPNLKHGNIMKKTNIRFVQKSDLEELIHLCEKHANFENVDYDPTNKLEKLKKHLFSDNPSLYCLVAEYSNELIGYTTYMKQFSTWDADSYIYMDCLFLSEKSRGFGLGEKLINRIKQEGTKLKCNHIQWQTPGSNTRAVKFYNRIGGKAKNKERYFLEI